MKRVFLPILFGAAIAIGAGPVRSDTPSNTAPQPLGAALETASHPVSCSNDAAARNRKRDAALADLGKRLTEQPPPSDDYKVLNRTGQNYGSSSDGR